VFWGGIGGGGNLVAVIMGCVVWGLGGGGLWVSMFDVLWVVFGVVVLGGGFWPQASILCVCARVRAWRIWYFYRRENFFNKCGRM